jgi:hypothetical protein
VHSSGHTAAGERAREEFWPRYLEVIRHRSKPRGSAIPSEESFSVRSVPMEDSISDHDTPPPRR